MVALCCAALTGPASAQAPEIPGEEELIVTAVEFQGLTTVSTAFCRAQILTAEGRSYSAATTQEDIRRLRRTGKFLEVRVDTAPLDPGRIRVIFILSERPLIEGIEFRGNVKFTDKTLSNDLQLLAGDPLSEPRALLGARHIEQRYRDAGYARVQVSLDRAQMRDARRLVFTIEEGPRVRIRKISFEGNTWFDDAVLKRLLSTKTYIPLIRTGDFSPDRAALDAAAIQKHYRDHGYLDARVSYRTDSLPTAGDLAVVFLINESEAYRISKITFEGNTVLDDEELRALMLLTEGSVVRLKDVRADVDAIRDALGARGYLDVQVGTPQPVFTEEPGIVELTFEILEGLPYRVGLIYVRRNEFIQDKVVRRELEFFPGEVYDTTAVRRSEQNLRASGLFDLVEVTPQPPRDDDVRDVLVEASDSTRLTNFLLGGGIGSNSGLAGSVTFESRNFDIADWPETFGEFLRARSFRGAGQYFRAELSPGTRVSSFRVVFREPYFLDKKLNFGSNMYLWNRGRDDWDERRLGTLLSLGRPFEEGWLTGWSGEVAFRLESVRIDDLDFFPADDIADAEGDNLLTSFKGRLARNTTDSRMLPSTGDISSLSIEQAFGSNVFTKLEAEYTWFKTLRIDDRDRKSVLALRGQVGFLLGDAPVFERYYAGGIGSMRGFDFRGVTPRDGPLPFIDDDQKIGGDFQLLFGAEYSFPLYGDILRGVTFTDMGTVEEDVELSDWRMSVGFGFRLLLEQIAPVPFEFNFATPIFKDGDDDTQVFSFALGITF